MQVSRPAKPRGEALQATPAAVGAPPRGGDDDGRARSSACEPCSLLCIWHTTTHAMGDCLPQHARAKTARLQGDAGRHGFGLRCRSSLQSAGAPAPRDGPAHQCHRRAAVDDADAENCVVQLPKPPTHSVLSLLRSGARAAVGCQHRWSAMRTGPGWPKMHPRPPWPSVRPSVTPYGFFSNSSQTHSDQGGGGETPTLCDGQ